MTLKANFGNIESNAAGVAKWIMTCSLSGRFEDFDADFSHSSELGGELTSLFDSENTHFLVKDVQVDQPGRDDIDDFLAKDGSVYRIFESDNVDTLVTDYNAQQASIVAKGKNSYELTAPVAAGFMFVQLSDPENGQQIIKNVNRSDGKTIKPQNCWLSKIRDQDNKWLYFINLFDANTAGSYTIDFGVPEPRHRPVMQYIPDRFQVEGRQLAFLVEASDPDGTIPSLSAKPLPAGATFTDRGNGTGIFDWTPLPGQAGQYEITFTASDGALEAHRTAEVKILTIGAEDVDGDGMSDAWELEHFGTLDRNGLGDFDGDGFSDLREALGGSNPNDDSDIPDPTTVYVDDDGSVVPELGTSEAPFDTITEGVTFAGPGDTIAVASGNYPENVMIAKSLTLMGENRETTVIDGTSANAPILHLVDVGAGSVKGFHIRNGKTAGIRCTRSTVTISGNRIALTNADADGPADGILIEDGSVVTIHHNLIHSNQKYGISVAEGCTADIVNNTIVQSGHTGIYCLAGDTVTIRNNIITESGINGIACLASEFPSVNYNNLWSNHDQNYLFCEPGTNDISSNPLFVDRLGHDFHLHLCSPSVDAGDPASDYTLEPLPNGGRINQGTYGGTAQAMHSIASFADLDGDGDVDGEDLTRMAEMMGSNLCGGCPEDLDGDDDVDADDMAVLACQFGKTGF